MRVVTIAVASLLAFACNERPTPTPEPPKKDDDGAELRALMNKQLEAIDKVHQATAFGDLATARKSADWLSKNAMTDPVPEEWKASVADVRARADKVAGGKKLEDIGENLGALLATCGGCHQRLGLALKASPTVSPDGPADEKNMQMLMHTFAMTQLEHGLLLPSESLWQQGAAMIEAGTFELPASESEIDRSGARVLASQLHELGGEAAAAKTLEAKGRIYGEMMLRCQTCHDSHRAGGSAP